MFNIIPGKNEKLEDELKEYEEEEAKNRQVASQQEYSEDQEQLEAMGLVPNLENVQAMAQLWGKAIVKDLPNFAPETKDVDFAKDAVVFYRQVEELLTKEFQISNLKREEVIYVQSLFRLAAGCVKRRYFNAATSFYIDIQSHLMLCRSVDGFQQRRFGTVEKTQATTIRREKGDFR